MDIRSHMLRNATKAVLSVAANTNTTVAERPRKSAVKGLPGFDGRHGMEIPVGEVNGSLRWLDVRSAPHVMVVGSTGMGKSVWINCLIGSLLRNSPDAVHLYLVDPLRVELSPFKAYPHVKGFATSVAEAAELLDKITAESERRYELFEKAGVRTLDDYNAKTGAGLPYLVLVLDEFAQLTGQKASTIKQKKEAAKSFEENMVTLAETARKSGIHLVAATQNPTAQIINSRMKTNFPAVVSFKLDSNAAKLVLKVPDAATLPGKGWLEYRGPGAECYRAKGIFAQLEVL